MTSTSIHNEHATRNRAKAYLALWCFLDVFGVVRYSHRPTRRDSSVILVGALQVRCYDGSPASFYDSSET